MTITEPSVRWFFFQTLSFFNGIMLVYQIGLVSVEMLSFLKSVLVAFFFLLLTVIVVLFGALFLFFVRTHEFSYLLQ
jgi:hypothetical protein